MGVVPKNYGVGSWISTKMQNFPKPYDPLEKVCKKGLTNPAINCIILSICCITMQKYAKRMNK